MAAIADLVVRLEGVFDLRAAQRVGEALSCVLPGGALCVDLTRVQDFQAAGVAELARTLRPEGRSVRVVLQGLRRHQVRLLRYLGTDPAALEDGPSPAAA